MNRRKASIARTIWGGVGLVVLLTLVLASLIAPQFLSKPNLSNRFLSPSPQVPFGTNGMGISLVEFATQGAAIVTLPAVLAGCVVMGLAVFAGISRCVQTGLFDTGIQWFSEMVGALPRMVVILVVALAVPREWRSMYPIAIMWAILAAPGAMDEAASTAERLGGARFVEALRAHGFSAFRIYFTHIVWMNLRSVIVRQGAEVMMQAVFLEVTLSYLAARRNQPSFTHSDSTYSWATLLYDGYTAIVAGVPLMHSLVLGLLLIGGVGIMAHAARAAARAR